MLFNNVAVQNGSKNVIIQYDAKRNIAYVSFDLDDFGKVESISAYGEVYHNISVNYNQSSIANPRTNNKEYTVTFLQFYYDDYDSYVKIIAEKNSSGEIFIIVSNIKYDVFSVIYENSSINEMPEELYFELVTDAGKSPNYGGMYSKNKDDRSFEDVAEKCVLPIPENEFLGKNTEQDILPLSRSQSLGRSDIASLVALWSSSSKNTIPLPSNSASESTNIIPMGASQDHSYNSRFCWIDFLNAIWANRSNGFTYIHPNYNINQNIFSSLSTTAGTAQWMTTSKDSFDYNVIRVAYYQPATGTYSLWLSLIGSEGKYIGSSGSYNINFKLGMHYRENDWYNDSNGKKVYKTINLATCRTEYNKTAKTIKYVADRGIKFESSIVVNLDKNTSDKFTRIERIARIDTDPNAWNTLRFFIGFIPYSWTLDAIELLLATTERPEKEWVYAGGDNINGVCLDLQKSGTKRTGLYRTTDYITINAYSTSGSTITKKIYYRYYLP